MRHLLGCENQVSKTVVVMVMVVVVANVVAADMAVVAVVVGERNNPRATIYFGLILSDLCHS